MHILFTRSLEDSKDLILRFNELGHKVSYMPVIQIKKVDHDVINFNDFGTTIPFLVNIFSLATIKSDK